MAAHLRPVRAALFLRNTSEARGDVSMAAFTDNTPTQTTLADLTPGFPVREETPVMHVRKRNGALEPVDVNKIVRAVQRSSRTG